MNQQRIQWIQQNPYFCLLPFTVHGVNVEFDGQRDPAQQRTWLRDSCCCNLEPGVSGFEDVKQSIVDGQPNSRCQRCYISEAETGTSERVMDLLQVTEKEIQQFQKTHSVDRLDYRIKFSNLCNLACRSCSPTFSSKYAETFKITVPAALNQDIGDDPAIWNKISQDIERYIKERGQISITLFGGETLIQPGLNRLLNWVEEKNFYSNISLGIASNLTKIEKISKIAQFREVHIGGSIDSVGTNYEYVRWPARWSTITDNLNQLVPLIQANRINFSVKPVFSLNNIFYLPEILDFWYKWFENNKINNVPIFNVVMYNPANLTVQNLPLEYRPALKAVFDQVLNHPLLQDPMHDVFAEYLKSIYGFLDTNVFHDQFDLYLMDTARHDRATGTSMQIGNNKLFAILNDHDRQLVEKFQTNTDLNLLTKKSQNLYHYRPL